MPIRSRLCGAGQSCSLNCICEKENPWPELRTTDHWNNPRVNAACSERADDDGADKKKCSTKDDQIQWLCQVHQSASLSEMEREV